MTAIAAVLLVPHEDHRSALLSEGPCGSRPPTIAVQWRANDSTMKIEAGDALVLRWNDRPLHLGLAQFDHALGDDRHLGAAEIVRALARGFGGPRDLLVFAHTIQRWGAVVCLDAAGNVVTP